MMPMSSRENLDFTNRFPWFVRDRRRSLGLNPYTLKDGRIGQKFQLAAEYSPLLNEFSSRPDAANEIFLIRAGISGQVSRLQ
jgi:hypothetical protein